MAYGLVFSKYETKFSTHLLLYVMKNFQIYSLCLIPSKFFKSKFFDYIRKPLWMLWYFSQPSYYRYFSGERTKLWFMVCCPTLGTASRWKQLVLVFMKLKKASHQRKPEQVGDVFFSQCITCFFKWKNELLRMFSMKLSNYLGVNCWQQGCWLRVT